MANCHAFNFHRRWCDHRCAALQSVGPAITNLAARQRRRADSTRVANVASRSRRERWSRAAPDRFDEGHGNPRADYSHPFGLEVSAACRRIPLRDDRRNASSREDSKHCDAAPSDPDAKHIQTQKRPSTLRGPSSFCASGHMLRGLIARKIKPHVETV